MIFINLLAYNLKRYDKKKENITSLENYIHQQFGSPREKQNKVGFILLKNCDPMLSKNKDSRYLHWEYLKTSVSIISMVGNHLWVKSISESSEESSSSSSSFNSSVESKAPKEEDKKKIKPAPKKPK